MLLLQIKFLYPLIRSKIIIYKMITVFKILIKMEKIFINLIMECKINYKCNICPKIKKEQV